MFIYFKKTTTKKDCLSLYSELKLTSQRLNQLVRMCANDINLHSYFSSTLLKLLFFFRSFWRVLFFYNLNTNRVNEKSYFYYYFFSFISIRFVFKFHLSAHLVTSVTRFLLKKDFSISIFNFKISETNSALEQQQTEAPVIDFTFSLFSFLSCQWLS